ncbi:MAG TPA: flagellar export chaperone FliS [Bacilli bacterium]
MINRQQNKYLETTIKTASPVQLLIMLCDGAIRFSKLGIEAIHQKRYEEANNNLVKVQNIIREFEITIDRSSPIAESLITLYQYFAARLIEANMKKDIEPAAEVLEHLIELKETWVQAAKIADRSALEIKHG